MTDFAIERIERCPKPLIRLAGSLGKASLRRSEKAFKAEGTKCVIDTLKYFKLRFLVATTDWYEEHFFELRLNNNKTPIYRGSPADFDKMTDFRTAPSVIAVYDIPQQNFDIKEFGRNLSLAIDGIQDPGNMGTILRTCDWFGIKDIVCSESTVDVYNPKVVQSTMGAISRMNVLYVEDLSIFLQQLANRGQRIYGTFLNGNNVFCSQLQNQNSIIVVGNEGKGISPSVESVVTDRITIPSFCDRNETSESLNVSAATAIIVASFRKDLI